MSQYRLSDLSVQPKAVRFGFVKEWRHAWPLEMLCGVMQVTARGFRKWLSRPMSNRQRDDMKVLVNIREQYGLSLGSYGRPRMTMEVREAGLDVRERRVGRLMRTNGIKPVHTRTHKVTTNSNHSLGIMANVLDGNFLADQPSRNGLVTSVIFEKPKVGSILP